MDLFDKIIAHANLFKANSPISTIEIFDKLAIFDSTVLLETKLKAFKELEFQLTFPIFTSEYLFVTSPDKFECGVSTCKNFVKCLNLLNVKNARSLQDFKICLFCNQYKKRIPLFKFIHLKFNKSDSEGTLEMADEYILSDLSAQKIAEKIICQHVKDRGIYHFVLIVSETEHFEEFDNRYFKEVLTDDERRFLDLGISHRKSKIFDERFIELSNDEGFRRKLLEYNKLKKIVKELRIAGFTQVSYLKGGLKEVHDIKLKYNLEVEGHVEENCRFCDTKRGLFGFRRKSVKKRNTETFPNVLPIDGVYK